MDDLFTARARKIYGGWEVTVAAVPEATFRHRDPTEDVTHEKVAAVLNRTDFEVVLFRDDAGRAPFEGPRPVAPEDQVVFNHGAG